MIVDEILNRLEVTAKDATVYFHISAETLKPILSVKELFEGVDRYFDDASTVCMPSFPFFGASYYQYMMEGNTFDVRSTVCRVNLISELFRRKEGVIRSVHPWCSVACYGKMAQEYCRDHHKAIEPFGPLSPFSKIAGNSGVVIGMGVNCNTNSFAHLPDDIMKDAYDFCVYEEQNVFGKCIDYAGNEMIIESEIVERTISKRIKPYNLREYLVNEPFYKEFMIGEVPFYAMNIKAYVEFVVELNRESTKINGKPNYYR